MSLPTWKANVAYEEGEEWVVSKMKTGYPRFFIHLIIQELQREILKLYGIEGEKVMLFPTRTTAQRCQAFFYDKCRSLTRSSVRLLHLEPNLSHTQTAGSILSKLSCVFFPSSEFATAKQVWQHSGDGIQSRRAEFCLKALREGWLVPATTTKSGTATDLFSKGGPRRYQRGTSQVTFPPPANGLVNGHADGDEMTADLGDYSTFIEERFGRNLNAQLSNKAKRAIRRRIAGSLTEDAELEMSPETLRQPRSEDMNGSDPSTQRSRNVSEDDVYLYPCGMNAIFNAHLVAMSSSESRGRDGCKSVCFGFPYIDTLKVLEKWGPGAVFYGNGDEADLADLERRLVSGERFAALFTEFPSNPLLRSPDLKGIRRLADLYGFLVVVDETVGNYINVDVLREADIVVSSLTKIFSGDSNVMGGSLVLNSKSSRYENLKDILANQYEDNVWAEDAIYMERNSRDFVSRIERINTNAEAMTGDLQRSPLIKNVYYPKLNPSKHFYDTFKTQSGGYGGLFSVTFHEPRHAQIFFDRLAVQKGPSLGTNFTLACPFVLLAHYTELDWVQQYGVDPNLVRVSVGLEDSQELVDLARQALQAVEQAC